MSKRGDVIRAAGGLLKRNNKLGVGQGTPTGGDEGEVRVQMFKNQPRLYAKAGGRWYNTPLYTTPVLAVAEDPTSGKPEFGGPVIAKSFLIVNGHRGMIDFQAESKSLSNISMGNSKYRPLKTLVDSSDNSNNVVVGDNAMNTTINGSENIVIGKEAMQFMGEAAGLAHGKVTQNIAIGNSAMKGATGASSQGAYNAAIGYGAMEFVNKGSTAALCFGNIAMGLYAGRYVSGRQNVYLGWLSGQGHSTRGSLGYNNVGVGVDALKNIEEAYNNIGIGFQAGDTLAGVNGGTVSYGNICIGAGSDVSAADAQNRVAIGPGVVCSTDDKTVLKNRHIDLDSTGGLTGQTTGGIITCSLIEQYMVIDKNSVATASQTKSALWIDYDHTGISASGQTINNIGADIDVNSDGATMVGTVNNTGIDLDVTGGTSGTQANIGIDVAVAGADTNYALLTSGGNVGFGVSDPASPVEIFNTASQLKISYDASNYADISVADDGELELATTGTDAGITLDASGAIVFESGGTVQFNSSISLWVGGTKIYFDSADTFIGSNTDNPEDMVIEADQDILMAPDNNLDIAAGGEIDFNASTCGFTAQTGTDAVSIDWGAGNKYHLLMENNSTVTFATNPSNPCNLLLKVTQGNGGSKIITWAVTSGDIYWAGGGKTDTDKPTLTTTDDDSDILSFYWDGTNYFGVASLNFDTAS